MFKFLYKPSKLLLTKTDRNINQCVQRNFLWNQTINFNCADSGEEEKVLRKKTPRICKITLIHPNKTLSVTTLEEAEKLANRRNFQLVFVANSSKSGRKVYQLKDSLMLNEPINNVEEIVEIEQKIKATKLFTIKHSIMNHDLDVKIKNINKILKKNFKAKIFFNHPNGPQEETLDYIKKKIEGVISEMQEKKGTTILLFLPALNNKNISSDDSNNNNVFQKQKHQ
ncbi:hypothetical protein WN51_04904 [Melipona quadrifasciata]|uniref:Translation initiation factor IF-3, mitochondrial n=1 Tax=Melipona quadrifasciata TaxID=166423 RepID=A0A0N0BDJ1_9HYME|nr:hypothetical protein WN51_04904 [Melipona quadrifasciata]